MHIHLYPTFSRYADPTDVPSLMVAHAPINFQPMQHQVETYQAVVDHRADVIIHSGITGDGKSLAGLLPTLLHYNHYVLAMYPTNELIADQKRQLEEAARAWGIKRNIEMVTAQTLDAQMNDQSIDRATALLSLLNSADVILTNPDIFHYIVTGGYVKFGQQPFRVLERIMQLGQIIIDEFHLFDQAQTTALLTAMIFLRQVLKDRVPVFVLQSATPNETILDSLKRGGLSIHEIQGSYLHQPDADPTYRRILHTVDLSIVSGESVHDWLAANAHDVLLPALIGGQGRGAALFTSVFEALEAYPVAKSGLPGMTVAHNTGLTPRSMRIASRHADLLLGTATVDTGVDLAINRLIFDAYDAANFRQRLGRLGRHSGYVDQHNVAHLFSDFAAVACVPPWVKAYLEEHATSEMPREDFFELVDQAYGAPRGQIYAYNRTWGWLPAYDLTYRMGHPTIRDGYKDVQQTTAKALSSALQVNLISKKSDFELLRGLKRTDPVDDQQKQFNADKRLIGDAAFAFRGSSPLAALIVNREYNGSERYQFYDLLSLLPRIDFKLLDYHLTREQAKQDGVPDLTLKREKPVIALEWQGAASDRRTLTLSLDRIAWRTVEAQSAQVVVTDGLSLMLTPPVHLGDDTVKRIGEMRLVMRIVLNHAPSVLRSRLRLGSFFPLYSFTSYNGQHTGSIALGRDALLLDAAVMYLRESEPGAFFGG